MTREEYLSAAAKRYEELDRLNLITDFYDYESEFIKIWQDLGREGLEKNLNTPVNDKRKKNLTTFGYITINNVPPFSKGNNGFQISSKFQEHIVYAAQSDSYENCNEVLAQFVNIKISAAQVWRVAMVYAEEVGKTIAEERILPPCSKDDTVYAMVDGSMLFTREEGWKEVKLGRIFKSSDCIHADGKQSWIKHSQYLAYLDTYKKFRAEVEKILDSYREQKQPLVFISDGAVWIKNWIDDAYPEAISVLDFYHASEYLHEFARTEFGNEAQRKEWTAEKLKLLSEGKVQQIIDELKQPPKRSKAAEKLIDYYESNKMRMNYPLYKTIGAGIIGSGAIESAHRTVIQKRMKQSGQRWSRRGAQNMLHLRVTKKNGQWSKIIELTKQNFKSAA